MSLLRKLRGSRSETAGGWPGSRLLVGLGLVLALLVLGTMLNGVIFRKSDRIVTSITQSGSENFTWAFNQIRVEFYRLVIARQAVLASATGAEDSEKLVQLRRRYELFVSRVNIVQQGVFRAKMTGLPIYDTTMADLKIYTADIDQALGGNPGFPPGAQQLLSRNSGSIEKGLDLLTAKALEVDSKQLAALRTDLFTLHDFEFANTAIQLVLVVGFGITCLVMLLRLNRQKRNLQRVAQDLKDARFETEKAALAERRALERALAEEQRMSQLQRRFVSMTSHEFRTPLAIIDSAAQRLLRKVDRLEPEEITRRIEGIRQTVARLGEILQTILEAGRAYDGKIVVRPVPFDIAALLRRVVRQQQDIAKQHQILLNLGEMPATMTGDQSLITQIIDNLLSNAIKYSPDRHPIILDARYGAGGIEIAVSDQGVGIPEDELESIFDVFYRASTSAGIPGTGLGLDLVRKFVELHGGTVSVTSRVAVGTTFTVRLPAENAATNARPALIA